MLQNAAWKSGRAGLGQGYGLGQGAYLGACMMGFWRGGSIGTRVLGLSVRVWLGEGWL